MDVNQLQQTETVTWINPASSIEFQASINSKELHQIESITGMKPEDYNAAAKGKIQYFKDIHYPLDLLLTPNKNTILHIYITSLSFTYLEFRFKLPKAIFRRTSLHLCPLLLQRFNAKRKSAETKFVKAILNICPLMLWQCNAKGETPFHIAARYGHAAIVEVLITHAKALFPDLESQVEVAKEMPGMTNQEGDTALHEAVRYNHLEVVRLLLAQDPNFPYSPNKVGETLLYMALERHFKDVTFEILSTCTSPAYIGPLGRTALHAATFWNEEGIIKRMRQKFGILTPLADQEGSTPLHLAAYFDCWRIVTPLLEDNIQMAYMKDAEGKTALHLAAYKGNHKVVRRIISSCLDCCELVDRTGCNALHFSVKGKWSLKTMRIFVDNPSLANLLNEKDVDGNTALYHHFKSQNHTLKSFVYDPRIDKLAFNNQNSNIWDLPSTVKGLPSYKVEVIAKLRRWNYGLGRSRRVVTGEDYNVKPEEKDKIDEIHPIVATLVATVSFAAGITMPGGFVGQDRPDPGSAVLATSLAFQAFVVCDSLALLLSTGAVLAYAIRAFPQFFRPGFEKARTNLATWAFSCTCYALIAMVLAFVAGTYAVLEHHYLNIAIFTWTPILLFMFVLYIYIFKIR